MISGVNLFAKAQMAKRAALNANQQLKIRISLRRSVISARAPAGSVKRKNGSVLAVDMEESKRGDAPIEFMAQSPPMYGPLPNKPKPPKPTQTRRKTGFAKKAKMRG